MGAFTIFKTKKKKTRPQAVTAAGHYEKLARLAGYFKYLTLFLLVVFVVFGFMFFGGTLSMENFRYMLKFMSWDADEAVWDGQTIHFDTEDRVSALLVGGNIAVADNNGLSVFGMAGERYLKDTIYYNEPMCVAAGNNIIMCDRKGAALNAYSVYAKVFTDSFPYPVLDLCASPSGGYAVLTASKGYRSGIEIYDKNFRLTRYHYFADRYSCGVGISADGKKAAVSTISNTSDGAFLGGLCVLDTADTDFLVTYEFPGEIPWKVWFQNNGSYVLLTNRFARIYSPGDELLASFGYGELSPKSFAFSDKYIALSLSVSGLSNATTVRFYTAEGAYIGEMPFHNDVAALDIAGGYAYIYSVGTLYAVNIDEMRTVRSDAAGLSYLGALYDEEAKRVAFIYTNKAVFYDNESYVMQMINGGSEK